MAAGRGGGPEVMKWPQSGPEGPSKVAKNVNNIDKKNRSFNDKKRKWNPKYKSIFRQHSQKC